MNFYFLIVLGVGLDIGTGFVKAVSDNNQLIFPSLYAYRDPTSWERTKERMIAIGQDAQELAKFPDSVVIRPVQEGRPVDDRAFSAILDYVLQKIYTNGHDSIHQDQKDIKIVVGLPYEARNEIEHLEKLVKEVIRPKALFIGPQVFGTLVNEGKKSGIVLSIGQGTSELVAFEDEKPIMGMSIPQATDYITQQFGEFAHLELNTFSKNSDVVKNGVEKLTDILANRVIGFQNRLSRDYELIVSGGGILIPGMQKALAKKIKGFIVPEKPVFSNALGLYKLTFEMEV